MEPGVAWTVLMIPLLPCAPFSPGWLGQATAVPISEELQSAGSWAFRYEVNRNVLPEVSARWTSTIAVPGRGTPGFRFLIAGSFHAVIWPAKIRARTWPFSLRCVDGLSPGTW